MKILDVIEATIQKFVLTWHQLRRRLTLSRLMWTRSIVIGKGGETIDKITGETGVKIDIDEDGLVAIFSPDRRAIERTKKSSLVLSVKQKWTKSSSKSGSFGEIPVPLSTFDKTDALVHVSEMAWTRVNKPEDLVEVGDVVDVKVIKLMIKGRIDVSMKALLPKPEGYMEPEKRERSENLVVIKNKREKR